MAAYEKKIHTSKMIPNMVTPVSDIIRELNNNPMVTNGDTDKIVAT
jgi:hypothetical protein